MAELDVKLKPVLKRFPPGDRWTPISAEQPIFSSLTEGIEWVFQQTKETNYLLLTDVAKDVYKIIGGGPVPIHIKPIWPFIAFTAFNSLPKEFKQIYGIKDTKVRRLIVNLNLKFLKFIRPFLPPFFRLIAPARWAKQRITKKPNLKFQDKSRI